jgi:plastocyanin
MTSPWTIGALGVVLGVLAAVGIASGVSDPASKCAATKIKTTAKKAAAKLGCYAKAVGKGVGVDSICLMKAEQKFGAAFGKAETKGGCVTSGDMGAIESTVDGFVANAVGVLPDGGTRAGQRCASTKLKATGKKEAAKLGCHAKAVLKGVAADPTCLTKAETSFTKRFGAAEAKGGCATSGDAGTVEGTVDAFVNDVVAALPTTTPTSTTTLPNTVAVGPGGQLTFMPSALTVHVGDTVHWVWQSSLHSVVSGTVVAGVEHPDGKFCSPNDTNCTGTVLTSSAGDTYSHIFGTTGTFPYYCQPHGALGMMGTITVQP